jgi:hypothetical protein
MSEKDPKTAAAAPVPPIHDDSFDPPANATTDPGSGSPIIEKPPFDGGGDGEK